jgi:hypothetical protein
VYLDSAELIGIAEGRADEDSVERLIKEMADRLAILVVSLEHLQEALPLEDSGAPERLADALERFRFRALVTRGPSEVEPWSNAESDIEIQLAANIREVLLAPEAAPKLAELSRAQDLAFRTIDAALGAERARPRLPIRQRAQEVQLASRVTLAHGWMGTEVDPIVRRSEAAMGSSLSEKDRRAVERALEPIAEALRIAGPELDMLRADRTQLARLMLIGNAVEAAEVAPGAFLAGRLWAARASDPARRLRRSDALDAIHAMHVPYVDVATCDREVFARIAEHIPRVKGSRSCTLLRNGSLNDVAQAVATLPFVQVPGDGSAQR